MTVCMATLISWKRNLHSQTFALSRSVLRLVVLISGESHLLPPLSPYGSSPGQKGRPALSHVLAVHVNDPLGVEVVVEGKQRLLLHGPASWLIDVDALLVHADDFGGDVGQVREDQAYPYASRRQRKASSPTHAQERSDQTGSSDRVRR